MAEPLPICYLNGEFLPFEAARVSPFDRGFLFGDGAYEVMPVYDGRPFRAAAHCARLTRSLAAIRMEDPLGSAEWRALFATLIEKNGGKFDETTVIGAGPFKLAQFRRGYQVIDARAPPR